MKKYRYWLLILLGQGLMWYNMPYTYHSNSAYTLWLIGMLVSFIGVLLQISVEPKKH